VIQVVTKAGGKPSVSGRAEGGSRATRRAAAATAGDIDGWKWQAGADYFADDGFTGIAPANGERVSNDDAEERQAWIGGGRLWSNGTDVQGTFRYVETDRGAPGAYGSDPAHRFFGVDRTARGLTNRRSVGVRWLQPWGRPTSRVRQRVEFDTADYDLAFVSDFPSEAETRRSHARVQTDAVLDGGFSISGGVEWLREQATNTFITSGPVKRSIVAPFVEGRWNGHERLMLQAGVRRDLETTNPKIAASWLAAGTTSERAWTRVRASAGTGLRPPDAFELTFTDNPALKPERSRSFEVGVTQALAGGLVTFDATTFFNEYDDLIVSVGRLSDISRYRTDNISNARSRGVEFAAAWRGGMRAQLRGTYTFLDAEILAIDRTDQAPPPYQVGDRLLRRPAHQGSLDFIWTGERVAAFASMVARGVTLDAEPAFGPSGGLYENPGRAVMDIGASFRVLRGVEIYGRVMNLFDKSYEEVLGYPAPGRTAFAGVRLAAGR
jgi:outer membrane cobalamin receptor